jgi:hypothetical protein
LGIDSYDFVYSLAKATSDLPVTQSIAKPAMSRLIKVTVERETVTLLVRGQPAKSEQEAASKTAEDQAGRSQVPSPMRSHSSGAWREQMHSVRIQFGIWRKPKGEFQLTAGKPQQISRSKEKNENQQRCTRNRFVFLFGVNQPARTRTGHRSYAQSDGPHWRMGLDR